MHNAHHAVSLVTYGNVKNNLGRPLLRVETLFAVDIAEYGIFFVIIKKRYFYTCFNIFFYIFVLGHVLFFVKKK